MIDRAKYTPKTFPSMGKNPRVRTICRTLRLKMFELHGTKCLRCGANGWCAPDHVIPWSKGGLTVIENLQPLCEDCNTWKGNKHIDYRKAN